MGIPLDKIPDIQKYLDNRKNNILIKRHVIAARITAEHAEEGFRPTTGAVHELSFRSSRQVWGYFSIGSIGRIHSFADSQFGHLFASGLTRDDARSNLIMALKGLTVRGEIRTNVEALIRILETPDFIANNTHTTWLESAVCLASPVSSRKLQTSLLQAVFLAAVYEANCIFRKSEEEFAQKIHQGQLPPPLTVKDKSELIYKDKKFEVQCRSSGPNRLTVELNKSHVEATIRRISADSEGKPSASAEGGFLVSGGFDGRSRRVYYKVDTAGLRVTFDGATYTFTKESDPTQVRAPVSGKLVRWLVANDSYVSKGTVYAEIEIMKMYMQLHVNDAGKVTHVVSEGAVFKAGDLLATLELSGGIVVDKASLYEGTFPVSQTQRSVGEVGDTAAATFAGNSLGRYRKAKEKVTNFLDGYLSYDGEPEEELLFIMESLLNERLPFFEMEEALSALDAQIPEKLSTRLRGLLASSPPADSSASQGDMNINGCKRTISVEQLPAIPKKGEERSRSIRVLHGSGTTVGGDSLGDGGGSGVVGRELPIAEMVQAIEMQLYEQTLPEYTGPQLTRQQLDPLFEVLSKYEKGLVMSAADELVKLIGRYLQVEEMFHGSTDSAAKVLQQKPTEFDVDELIVFSRSHQALKQKNKIVAIMLEFIKTCSVWESSRFVHTYLRTYADFMEKFPRLHESLQRLSALTKPEYTAVSSRARQLLLTKKQKPFVERTKLLEHKLQDYTERRATAGSVTPLLTAVGCVSPYGMNSGLGRFVVDMQGCWDDSLLYLFAQPSRKLRKLALEIYIRRHYDRYNVHDVRIHTDGEDWSTGEGATPLASVVLQGSNAATSSPASGGGGSSTYGLMDGEASLPVSPMLSPTWGFHENKVSKPQLDTRKGVCRLSGRTTGRGWTSGTGGRECGLQSQCGLMAVWTHRAVLSQEFLNETCDELKPCLADLRSSSGTCRDIPLPRSASASSCYTAHVSTGPTRPSTEESRHSCTPPAYGHSSSGLANGPYGSSGWRDGTGLQSFGLGPGSRLNHMLSAFGGSPGEAETGAVGKGQQTIALAFGSLAEFLEKFEASLLEYQNTISRFMPPSPPSADGKVLLIFIAEMETLHDAKKQRSSTDVFRGELERLSSVLQECTLFLITFCFLVPSSSSPRVAGRHMASLPPLSPAAVSLSTAQGPTSTSSSTATSTPITPNKPLDRVSILVATAHLETPEESSSQTAAFLSSLAMSSQTTSSIDLPISNDDLVSVDHPRYVYYRSPVHLPTLHQSTGEFIAAAQVVHPVYAEKVAARGGTGDADGASGKKKIFEAAVRKSTVETSGRLAEGKRKDAEECQASVGTRVQKPKGNGLTAGGRELCERRSEVSDVSSAVKSMGTFYEETLLRNVDVSLFDLLELKRLRNFWVRVIPMSVPHVHLFEAVPKKMVPTAGSSGGGGRGQTGKTGSTEEASKNAGGGSGAQAGRADPTALPRFFVRIVLQQTSKGEDEGMAEVERYFVSGLNALEVATRSPYDVMAGNHMLMTVRGTFSGDFRTVANSSETNARLLFKRYEQRLAKCKVNTIELRFIQRPSAVPDFSVPIRLVLDNPTGQALRARRFVEVINPTSGDRVFSAMDATGALSLKGGHALFGCNELLQSPSGASIGSSSGCSGSGGIPGSTAENGPGGSGTTTGGGCESGRMANASDSCDGGGGNTVTGSSAGNGQQKYGGMTSLVKECDYDGQSVDVLHPLAGPLDQKRALAASVSTVYIYDFLDLFEDAIKKQWRTCPKYFFPRLDERAESLERKGEMPTTNPETTEGRVTGQSTRENLSGDTRSGMEQIELLPPSAVIGGSGGGEEVQGRGEAAGIGGGKGHCGPGVLPSAATFLPNRVFEAVELSLTSKGQLEEVYRDPGQNECGMVAWKVVMRTPEFPKGRRMILIGNDVTFQMGTFGVQEDLLFQRASEFSRKHGIPRIYIAVNSGARMGLATDVQKAFQIEWLNPENPSRGFKYLYLTEEDYRRLESHDAVVAEPVQHPTEGLIYRITDVIGSEIGLGVENLCGSGAIAGETSRAYNSTMTITYVSGRTVGIGAYLTRLGQRVIQKSVGAPILLTGYQALNRLIGRDVYTSNEEIGGTEVMHRNGVSHLVVRDDSEGCEAILDWLGFVPEHKEGPLPIMVDPTDPITRPILYKPMSTTDDPRLMLTGCIDPRGDWLGGIFDRGSFKEVMSEWARSAICGRARLGGIPVGVIFVETRVTESRLPADPAMPQSSELTLTRAGQVWFPDSAYKTAQAIFDFNQEELPLMIFANWRGFSGGQRDMFNEVLKFGSFIVDALVCYRHPCFVYIPPKAELRGGAWVVVDPRINVEYMEMYADSECRGGVLEPTGTVEIKFREKALIETASRIDPVLKQLAELDKALAVDGLTIDAPQRQEIKEKRDKRIHDLLPVYKQCAIHFADLHDTPVRMRRKHAIHDIVSWEKSRHYFYWRLRRQLILFNLRVEITKVNPNYSISQAERLVYRWAEETGHCIESNYQFVQWACHSMQELSRRLALLRRQFVYSQTQNYYKESAHTVLEAVRALQPTMFKSENGIGTQPGHQASFGEMGSERSLAALSAITQPNQQ
eukprot:GHVQ01015864.1.p1 GENE.GHVQ01015864.1~~GHVQ01015864.1.p1  ORF type:complete len:2586 (+),score=270.64 GHVQ01015864.1:249-8006(+)